MAFHRFLMLLVCLVAVINNLVTLASARQLQNSPNDEKEVNDRDHGGDHQGDPVSKNNKAKMELNEKEAANGGDQYHGGVQVDPNRKNTKPKTGLGDQKQLGPFPYSFPPFPFAPSIPGIPGFPMPIPTPFGIPGIPALPIPAMPLPPFPPLDIPGVVPTPPT